MKTPLSKPALQQLHKCQGKTDLLDDVLDLLKRLLDYCLCCLTCGCYPGPGDDLHAEVYEAELTEEERTAVERLLGYLDSGNINPASSTY